jgi:hypothetical protein
VKIYIPSPPHTPHKRNHNSALGRVQSQTGWQIPSSEVWVLSFRAEGHSDVPTEIRIRKLLKIALRQLGLRCCDFRIAANAETPQADAMSIDPLEIPTRQISSYGPGNALGSLDRGVGSIARTKNPRFHS